MNEKSESGISQKTNKKSSINIKQAIIQLSVYFGIFAVSLIAWELILRLQMGNGISAVNLFFLLFIPSEAMLLAGLNGFFKKILNRILLPLTLLAISLFYCVQLVYYRIFGSLLSVSLIGMGKEAIGNFGWAMTETLLKSVGFLLLILLPFAIVLILCITKKIKCDSYLLPVHFAAILLSVIFWFLAVISLKIDGSGNLSAYNIFVSSISNTDTTASRVGAMPTFIMELGSSYLGLGNKSDKNVSYESAIRSSSSLGDGFPETSEYDTVSLNPQINKDFDFEKLAENAKDEDTRKMYEFFADRAPSYTNEYTGIMEGYNLIFICAESFWTYCINEKVTPTLYKMSNEGIIANNYYNSFRNTTVNGEFAFSTGLWPDVSRNADRGLDSGSMPQSSYVYMPLGLGKIFKNEGIPSYAFHNYYGSYYRRSFSWQNLGFENLYFMDEGMTFTTKWPSSDYEMMQQSVDKYISEDRFFAYYMTFSGHGPYNSKNCIYRKNIDEVKSRLGEEADSLSTEALGYLAANLEFEYAMEYLVNRLEEEGKLDKTLIVISGDHYPYYMGEEGRNQLAKKELSDMDLYHAPCIMYTTGLEENIVTDTYCCNVDIIPTVLNLLGINYDSRLFIGRDIFSPGIHKAVLYDKSFITDKVEYNVKTGIVNWKIDESQYDRQTLQAYLDKMNGLIESEYSASLNIINDNFYFTLWQDANLLLPEEITEETKRENAVKEDMKLLNESENRQKEEDFLDKVDSLFNKDLIY
ncbi:MAG: sulfatase-like hydrolase/transferase [Lachnospiraceae bacterium]|nr:sulfatase-like hydrolase/transferase [Lachnospiraceae bacterium]